MIWACEGIIAAVTITKTFFQPKKKKESDLNDLTPSAFAVGTTGLFTCLRQAHDQGTGEAWQNQLQA